MLGRSKPGGNEWSESGQAQAQRRPRAISGGLFAVGVLANFAGLLASVAGVQTAATLVSNTDQQQNTGASRVVEAQSFTTGPHGIGYTLSSVRLRLFLDLTGDTETLVTIKTDSGVRPGTLIAALETPGAAYVPGNFFAYTTPATRRARRPTRWCWTASRNFRLETSRRHRAGP